MPSNSQPLIHEKCYVNGEWIRAKNSKTTQVFNPADQSLIASIPDLDASEIDLAIKQANTAWQVWKKTTAMHRANILNQWSLLVNEHKNELAQIVTLECGKPLAEALTEIDYANSFISWFAEEAKRTYGDTIPSPNAQQRIWTIKQSIGVCGLITPWNFPAAMITRKAAPALAAGCSVVIKPAPQTPFTALAFADLAHQAGLPKGLINIVTGDAEMIGECLTQNPLVKKISFTGSTNIGKKLISMSANNVQKVSMELGGNAPFIVFEDADIDVAVNELMNSKFRNTGQACISPNRVYVHRKIIDEFSEKLKVKVSNLVVGNGMDEGVNLGPLINEAGLVKLEHHIKDAINLGAEIIYGGRRHKLKGNFHEPTILNNVAPNSLCCLEETFAPLIPIILFDDEDTVIFQANDTEFGLAAYFFTQNINRIHRVSEALESGMIGINSGAISTSVAPFGGIKSSGIGREGSYQGIEEYMETKYINLGNLDT